MSRSSEALRRRRERCPPVEPCPEAPRYNHACHAGFVGRMEDAWFLQLRRTDGTKAARVPYHCGSRRHRGPCQDLWARRTRARMLEVLGSVDPRACMLWVLTLDKLGRFGGRRFSNRQEAYRALPWAKLQERLNYRLRKMGLERLRYAATVERHKDGFPHLNVLVVDEYLAERLRERDVELGQHPELEDDDRILAPALWRELSVAAGFGPRFTAEVARSIEDVAGYITKVAKGDDEWEDDGEGNLCLIGEVVKGSQAPEDAPKNHRSLRCSRRFLPARERAEGWTGWMEDADGNRIVRKPKPPSIRDGELAASPGDVAVVLGGERQRPRYGRVWHPDPKDGRFWDDPAEAHRIQSLEPWKGPARIPVKRYTIEPYDQDDSRHRPEPLLLVPDPTGPIDVHGRRFRVEPRWTTVVVDCRPCFPAPARTGVPP